MPPLEEEQGSNGRGRLPTSIDVAVLAQVSQSTVSRALRGDPSVSLGTRKRVMRIADELGYRPDSRAVRLREGFVGTIAVVLLFPETVGRQALNPFYYDVLGAVEAAASRRGVSILLSGQSQSSSLRSDFERRREADGVIVIGTASNRPGWDFFTEAYDEGANIVAWGAPDDRLPTVRADNRRAGGLAAAHLVACGRRRLAFAGPGFEGHAAFRLRREGFLAALERHGLADHSPELTVDTADRMAQGECWSAAALAAGGGIDGVFAASDLLALGVLRGLSRGGRRVPEDVALVGFDGGQGARHCTPALTTIEQDVARAGELLLGALLDGNEASKSAPADVPVQLVVRESSSVRPGSC